MYFNRYNIIKILKDMFIKDDNVHAFWLEGADALEAVDEFSDIDMWFDIEDGSEDLFVVKLKKTLESISHIDFMYEKRHEHPKIRQFFIHLQETSVFLIIDLCIQSHSRKIKFIKENKDEKVKVIFDKTEVIQYTCNDIDKFDESITIRKKEIEKTFEFFAIWIQKEINRNNYLEALNYYNEYILNPLVEYLRILYEPTKKDYELKHIKRDLPIDVVKKLECYYKISSIDEIGEKASEAVVFFRSLLV